MQMIDVLKRLQEIAETKPELVKDAVENVEKTNPKVNEGGMSDIHIGAQEAMADYLDGPDGDLTMPKKDVIADLMAKSKKASFPTSYEYSTAADMVMDKFDEKGQRIMDKEESINTSTMENKKDTVNEAIQMTADTPEEAGMLMQILKLAGVKPVDAKMMGMDEPEQQQDHGDDNVGSMDMSRMKDIVNKPDEEKAEETFANAPDGYKGEPETHDVDTLVNVHSGGANKQKVQYRKEYPGDNPMAAEDKITEQDLADSLRAQYEGFKQAYQEAAKPDFLDLDKDGDKKEPMKKAAKDKEQK